MIGVGEMTSCTNCGRVIPRKAKRCPYCGFTEKKPFRIYKKWWFWVIVVLVIGLIGSANDDKYKDNATKVGSVQDADVSTPPKGGRQDGDASGGPVTEPSNVFHPGDIIETDDFRITYRECDTDWVGYNQYWARVAGKKVVRTYFIFENISDKDQDCGRFEFDCYADNVSCDHFSSGNDVMKGLEYISPGRKLQGYVAFEVPVDAKTIELEYETSFWSQKKVIFMVE